MTKDRLICKSLSIHTTSACTLRCAKCGWAFPYYTDVVKADLKKTVEAFEKVFQIYDEVVEVRFGGAEAFLYPEIKTLMCSLEEHKSYFKYAIVVTNGTYIPQKSILNTIKKLSYPMIVRVDNYGSLSKKYGELVDLLHSYDIQVDERVYSGDNQAFGGWIDLGDYSYKHYTPEQVKDIFYYCRVPDDCTILLDDTLTICSYAFSGSLLGKIKRNDHETVSLSSEQSIEELRNSVKAWRKEPLTACHYCNGCDPVRSLRISAAEQLGEREIVK